VHFDPKLRDEVVARVDRLNLPSYKGFVMPKLTAVQDRDGRIADVTISYPLDLTAQMLEYAGVKR
jgi:dipeptidyl-peptidase-3